MNRLDITGLARIRLNQLSEFMDGAVYGLGVLHPPGVLAYLSSGQYNAGISHEIKQKGKFPVAQAYGPSAYFRFLPGWVNINVSYREGGCFRAGGIVVMIVFGVSPELSIGTIDISSKGHLLSGQIEENVLKALPVFLNSVNSNIVGTQVLNHLTRLFIGQSP